MKTTASPKADFSACFADRDLPYNSYPPMYYLFILARVKGRPPSNGSDQDSQAVAEEKWPVRTTTRTCVRDQAVILRGRDHIHDIESDLMVNPFLDCDAGVSRSVDEKNQPQKLEFESYPLSFYSRANVQQREDARMHEAVPKGCIPCTAGMYAFLSARKLKKIVSSYCRYPSRIGFH